MINEKLAIGKTAFILLVFLVFSSCYQPKPEAEKKKEVTAEIDALITKWHKDAGVCNLQDYIGAMAKDAVYLGTDATEYWTKKEFEAFCKPYFNKKTTWNFKLVKRNIYLSNDYNIAWFDELLDTKLGLCRGSGVLQKNDGKWQIEQYVLSPTVPNDKTKEVIALKRETDSLLIIKLGKR